MFGVLLLIGLQARLVLVSLRAGWMLIGTSVVGLAGPAGSRGALLLALSSSLPRHRFEQMGALIAIALSGHENSGSELLLKGATFSGTKRDHVRLLLWEFDRRAEPAPRARSAGA